jgi:hypothetical protein
VVGGAEIRTTSAYIAIRNSTVSVKQTREKIILGLHIDFTGSARPARDAAHSRAISAA